MALFELRHTQLGLGAERLLNVYHYHTGEGVGTTAKLVNAFETTMVPLIRAIQCSGVSNSLLSAISIFDLGDFTEKQLTGNGTDVSSNMLPLHDAVTFSLRRNTRVVRPGSKRYSGIPSTKTLAGTVNDATYITALNALRVALYTPLVDTDTVSYTPVIVKRVKETDTETGAVTYRMPATTGELEYGVVVGALVNLRISNQTSRWNGRN